MCCRRDPQTMRRQQTMESPNTHGTIAEDLSTYQLSAIAARMAPTSCHPSQAGREETPTLTHFFSGPKRSSKIWSNARTFSLSGILRPFSKVSFKAFR
eukprot:CAMPEP_0183508788 /NCGR_PEP_ID=MMETSP0371-20130417/9118_1 /TAXON_ID=268820 /ORGANISM="Peridinium aciculiferum, Strain PAER-2" /LENGTH=97 /DNA_ID=CAMNT_0025705243 /DNA_START=160 /DNA_END=449 /DNA_ORIENTATION=+